MCRWAAYIGEPIYLEEIVSAPCKSLLHQSLHARESKTETNGDGFGVAWYGQRACPGLYRDVLPAWADANLASMAHQVQCIAFWPMSARRPVPRPAGRTAIRSPWIAALLCTTGRSAASTGSGVPPT